jgi:transmembrane sensor
MALFSKILELSKQLGTSLLMDEKPLGFENSEIFDQKDKDYILNKLTSKAETKARFELFKKIDKKKDFKKTKGKLNISTKNLHWRYAVAASVALCVGSAIFFLKDNMPEHPTFNSISTNVTGNIIEPGSNKATLILEDGSVIVLEKGKSYQNDNINSNGEEIVVRPKHKAHAEISYNSLTISRGGQFYIKLSDGTEVWLNSESQLKFPETFVDGEMRSVELVYGEAYFDVSSSENHKGSKFMVLNQNLEIEVLGTEFNIKAYKDESHVYTTLVEGKVKLGNGTSIQNLMPNEQSKLDIKNNVFSLDKVDVDSEISWKRGIFSFKGKPLKEIMRVISRWYNVEVVFEDSKLGDVLFRGVLGKDQDIEELLSTIKNLSIINNYEINDRQIILK